MAKQAAKAATPTRGASYDPKAAIAIVPLADGGRRVVKGLAVERAMSAMAKHRTVGAYIAAFGKACDAKPLPGRIGQPGAVQATAILRYLDRAEAVIVRAPKARTPKGEPQVASEPQASEPQAEGVPAVDAPADMPTTQLIDACSDMTRRQKALEAAREIVKAADAGGPVWNYESVSIMLARALLSSAQDAMLDGIRAALSIIPPMQAARIVELERQRAALVAFAKHCFRGTDLDGADVQDLAVKHGLLVETQYAPAIHGPNDHDVEAGDPWFVFADWLKP